MVTFIPRENMEVYTIDGHLVGRVAEAWANQYASSRTLARAIGETGEGYFRLAGFGKGDLYVPLDALADYTEERIRLRITKRQLGARGWDKRPADLPPG